MFPAPSSGAPSIEPSTRPTKLPARASCRAVAPPPAIRRATARDAALLAELGARTFSETFGPDNTPEDIAAYLGAAFGPEKQAAELADPGATFLVADVEGVAAGYAQLRSGGTDGVTGAKPIEVVRFYASKEWIGRGIGPALMGACLDEARRAGFQTLWLGVWERNVRAQAFYRKWGFSVVGAHVFQLGSDPQTDLLMERPVSSPPA
jgi:ribosomal protein S18 acetylase RimI-like enzyme